MDITLLFIVALLILTGILVSPLSSRIGMPVLLLFLAVGMLAGEDGPGGITFNSFDTSFLVGNLALAVILLDGGMRTNVNSFRVGLRPAILLATLGVVITAAVAGLAAIWLLDLPPAAGLLTGALISSTDAAAVFSILQSNKVNLNERVEATLEIESGSNDPMALFLTLVLIQALDTGVASPASVLLMLGQQFGLGLVAGLAGGYLMTHLISRIELVGAMYPLLVVSGGIALFCSMMLLGGSGFLAVYLMGVILASNCSRRLPGILQIHDGLAWLAQFILFLLLGLLVTPSRLVEVAPEALLISLVLILVARPLGAFVSLLPFGFSWREQLFISWVGLRGAVPIVLALYPLMAATPFADTLFMVTFVVVLVSLVLQGSTLGLVARLLKLEVPGQMGPQLQTGLDIPETGDHEMLLYRLEGKRWRQPQRLEDIHLPEPSRIVAVFRAGTMFAYLPEREVYENDIIAVFARHEQVDDISRILGWKEPPERLTDQRFFGEFVVSGKSLLGDIATLYGVTITAFDPAMTLSQCLIQSWHGHPVVGDRLDLGAILLVAREVRGDEVITVGLKLRK